MDQLEYLVMSQPGKQWRHSYFGVPEDTLVLELNECGVVTESEVDECVATKVDVVTVVTLELAAAVSLPALDVSLVEMLAVGGAESCRHT